MCIRFIAVGYFVARLAFILFIIKCAALPIPCTGNASNDVSPELQSTMDAHLGEEPCVLRRLPLRRPPTGIRTSDLKIPKGAFESRTYKRVSLPPLCGMNPSDRGRSKPTLSWVFYSPFNCEQRLKMLHVGFHPDAKHLLEAERVESDMSGKRKASAHSGHVHAVKESLRQLPCLAEHVLAHFRVNIRDCYRPVAAKQALRVLGRYLAGYRLYRETGQPTTSLREDAIVQTSQSPGILLSLIRNEVDRALARHQDASDRCNMHLLFAELERAKLREAHDNSTSSRWPGLSAAEADVVDTFDERLLDLAALRGYVDRLYRAGSASSSIAGVLAVLVKSLEWRRSFHQSISNGLLTSAGGLQTANGFAMTRFDEAIQMLRQLSRHYRRNGGNIDNNRNIPQRVPRAVVPDLSVYEDLCTALEGDILAFESTAVSWSQGRRMKEQAFHDLQAAVVSFINCGFVPARPLPLASLTLGQWRAAKHSAQMRYEALLLGAKHGGPPVDDDTLLKPMCSLEKGSAQRNGRHQFFITRRLLRVMRIFELARSCILGAQQASSALFTRNDGSVISSTQMSSLLKKTTLWYTGHAVTFVMLRKAHASALAGSGVARLERSIGEVEREARASTAHLDSPCQSPKSKRSTRGGVSFGRTPGSGNTAMTRVADARDQLSRTAFTESKDMTPGQNAAGASAALGGVDIGHGQKSQNRYYLTPGLETRHSFAARRLAVASSFAETPNVSHTTSFDHDGTDIIMGVADQTRFTAIEYATQVRAQLSKRPASDYINPCAEP